MLIKLRLDLGKSLGDISADYQIWFVQKQKAPNMMNVSFQETNIYNNRVLYRNEEDNFTLVGKTSRTYFSKNNYSERTFNIFHTEKIRGDEEDDILGHITRFEQTTFANDWSDVKISLFSFVPGRCGSNLL